MDEENREMVSRSGSDEEPEIQPGLEQDKGPLLKIQLLENDALEKDLKALFESVEGENPNIAKQFSNIVLNHAFQTTGGASDEYNNYLKNLYKGKVIKPAICGGVVDQTNTKFIYRCLDCRHQENAIICAQCFEEPTHKTHKVYRGVGNGVCDCGDPNLWNPKGFCQDHLGYVQEDDTLPEDRKKSFSKSIKKAFYFIFQLIETISGNQYRKNKIMNEIIEISENGIGKELEVLIHDYPTLQHVLSDTLKTPINDSKSSDFKMLHRHDNYETLQDSPAAPEPCDCSFMDLLLRYSNFLAPNNGGPYTRLLIPLNSSVEFKKYVSLVFIKHYKFMFKVFQGQEVQMNGLQSMHNQYLNTQILSNLIYDSGAWKHWFNAMNTVVSKCKEISKQTGKYPGKAFNEICSTLYEWFTIRDGFFKLFSDKEVMKRFFELMRLIQESKKNFYPRSLLELKPSLMVLDNLDDDTVNSLIYQDLLIKRQSRVCLQYYELGEEQLNIVLTTVLSALIEQIMLMNDEENAYCLDLTLERLFIQHLLIYFHTRKVG